MSVYLKGDGQNYSSIAFSTITLPNPAISPDIMEDNVDVVESDAGYQVCYEKGTYRRIFPYRFSLLSDLKKEELWVWWQKIKGRFHWFLLQPSKQVSENIDELEHEVDMGNDKLVNAQFEQAINFWKGFWTIILTGDYSKTARKIIYSEPDIPNYYIQVFPAFEQAIPIGNVFIIGFPVTLDESRIQFIPRHPNFWDVEIVFKEKIIDIV
jgi:hypothetical protein